MGNLWLDLQLQFSRLLYNHDLNRDYEASLAQRTEGFTESWNHETANIKDTTTDTVNWISTYPQENLILHQYQPAYREILALTLSKLPFVIVNEKYHTMEATGMLPCLQDHNEKALVGRQQNILQYLKEVHKVDLNQKLSDEQILKSNMYRTVIGQLEQIASFFSAHDMKRHKTQEKSYWAKWAQRVHLESISSSWTADEAKDTATQLYAYFEQLLKQQKYLVSEKEPSEIDTIFFDHVMQATNEPTLVVLIASYPRLVEYAQDLLSLCNSSQHKHSEWNRIQLMDNIFTRRDSASFLEQIATDTLKDKALLAANVQESQARKIPKAKPFQTWHRWRMGDTYKPKTNVSPDDNAESMRKQYKKDDELWISTMLAVTSVTVVAAVTRQVMQQKQGT